MNYIEYIPRYVAYSILIAMLVGWSITVTCLAMSNLNKMAKRQILNKGVVRCLAIYLVAGFLTLIAYPSLTSKNLFRIYNSDPDIQWLTNRGCKVYTNRVYVAFSAHQRLPTNAVIQLWTMTTNGAPAYAEWTTVDERPLCDYILTDDIYGYLFHVDEWGITNAIQHQWVLTTTYIRPTDVATNGVLHANWLLPEEPTNSVVKGVPIHTGVSVDGKEIDMMTKKKTATLEEGEGE